MTRRDFTEPLIEAYVTRCWRCQSVCESCSADKRLGQSRLHLAGPRRPARNGRRGVTVMLWERDYERIAAIAEDMGVAPSAVVYDAIRQLFVDWDEGRRVADEEIARLDATPSNVGQAANPEHAGSPQGDSFPARARPTDDVKEEGTR